MQTGKGNGKEAATINLFIYLYLNKHMISFGCHKWYLRLPLTTRSRTGFARDAVHCVSFENVRL